MVRRYLASITLPVTPPAAAEKEASGDSANCSSLMSTVTSLAPYSSCPVLRSSCHPSAVRTPGRAGTPDQAGAPDPAAAPEPADSPDEHPGQQVGGAEESRAGG